MEIRKVPISDVDVWDKNPRNITTGDFARLKRQIKELGVYKPLLCYRENGKYVTLGGNMRLRALKEMNIGEIEISIVNPKSEADKIKYALSDNDRAGEYNEQQLAELTYPHMEEINLDDFKIDVGQPISLKDLIEDYAPDIDGEDEIPEIDDSPAITKMGDLFTLGKHRLLCGDATKEEDVKKLMGGEKADMVFTDPPYNVDYGRNQAPIWGKNVKLLKNDCLSDEEWEDFQERWLKLTLSNLRGAIYICMSAKSWASLRMAFEKNGGHWSSDIIWIKDRLIPGRKNYNSQYEALLYGWPEGSYHIWKGKTNEVDVWEIKRHSINEYHPTQKPFQLIIRALKNSSMSNNRILDMFLGSGTTLIACQKLNRICYGMEIEPKYCDVIITRYANFTDIPEEEIRATKENNG